MREIKFRGLHIKSKEWMCGHLLSDEAIGKFGNSEYYSYSIVDPKTIGQFTGLKDKNGKDIYEGDIVRCFLNEEVIGEIDIVEFRFGCFWLKKRYLSIHEFENMDLEVDGSLEIEIIGNIHQNLELNKD